MILLDSGAFTAANKGICLSVAAYIAFIRREATAAATHYIGLDVIPGSLRHREWRLEYIEAAAAQSYKHQQMMKAEGLSPIPVFHQGDPWHWLERYLADGESYVALSTNKAARRHEHMVWLDDCFALLTKRRPLVRTHALGVSSNLLCSEYPWSSFDSGRWFKCGAHGQILVPEYSGDRPDWSLPPRIIFVTDQMIGRRKHIDTLDDHDRDHVNGYLREAVGCDLEDVRYDHWSRHQACAIYLRNAIGPRLFFVVNSFEQVDLLAQCQVQSILVSYAYLKDKPEGTLGHYAERLKTKPRSTANGRGSKVVRTNGSGKRPHGQFNGHRGQHQTQ